jgi:pyruvate dehydrogenase E2 component (dihydrolipoamide acetyltransferase)
VPTEVVMPALGMAQESGKLLRWLKAEGDPVSAHEPLMEVETDKVTVEIESPAGGVLADVRAGEGDDVPVGDVIALILAEGESAPGHVQPAAEATPLAAVPIGEGSSSRERVPSSPLARRRAKERGVDLGALRGTGPGGAVVAEDVALEGRAPSATSESAPAGPVWQRMVERTSASWTTAPHFYLFRDVEAETLVDWRASIEDRGDGAITITDLLVKVAAEALRRHPEVLARWDGSRVVQAPEVNVGIAVAIDDGLVVPVIHGADALTVEEVAARRRDLVERARAGSLGLDDVRDGTFTLTNLGMYTVDAFAAVINPPQAAILATGRIAERVVPVDGRPAVRRVITLGLSCDHRAIDGARAARFLDTLASLIVEPPGFVPART